MDGNEKKTVAPVPDVDDRPLVVLCHFLALAAYSCHLYPGRCVGLGGLYAVAGCNRWYFAASLGVVVEGRGSSMAQVVHILVHMGLGDMNLEGVEGVQEGTEPHSSVGKLAGVVPGEEEGQDN